LYLQEGGCRFVPISVNGEDGGLEGISKVRELNKKLAINVIISIIKLIGGDFCFAEDEVSAESSETS
jgi:hypothetical protein